MFRLCLVLFFCRSFAQKFFAKSLVTEHGRRSLKSRQKRAGEEKLTETR